MREFKKQIFSGAALLLTAFAALPGFADDFPADSHVIPISIGGDLGTKNEPFVSVTLCEPGTSNCQTVPDIILDTGSTGLRIFSSKVQLNLPAEPSGGKAVAECVEFGGGDIFWGPVLTADVILGGEKASNVPMHLVDAQFASVPKSCNGTPDQDPNTFGANGILGISPASTDCDGLACPGTTPGKSYFACSGTRCETLSPSPDEQVQNPVGLMVSDNNGIVVSFPAIQSHDGVPSLQGALILGIGTRSDNQPGERVRAYATDPDGILKARFQGQEYWTKFDTGSPFWSLPVSDGIPVCGNYLCAPSPTDRSFAAIAADGSESPAIGFTVGDSQALMNSSNIAFDDVAWNNALPESFMVSLPFFYGRSVFVGISGHSSSLGSGPFYGF